MSILLFFTTPTVAFAEGEPVATEPAPATTTETATPPPATTTEAPPAPAPTEPTPAPTPVVTTPGPQEPSGADANTYTFNPTTGMWENGKYAWDPVTKQTKPLIAPTYSYNPEKSVWETTEWIYDVPTGTYVPNVISAATPPADAVLADGSTLQPAPSATPGDIHTSALQPALATTNSDLATTDETDSTETSSGIFDLFYNALISNNIDSSAITGDALVAMNTLAGNAISGSATTIANIINLLQSSWSTAANTVTTFVGNLMGNMFGDLFIDPGNTSGNSSTLAADTTINSTQNSTIDNTIKLAAVSGDATVTKNTQAGDAQTGDATAVANLINAINSSIATNQSFVGMLNIFGDLNGDILLPQSLMDTLIASNAVGALDTSNITNGDILASFSDNQTINNNITTTAGSGNSSVDQNTSAGNATTGDANTNVTLLNLTGRQVIGKDALLVFVNVLGEWVGMIVNAPAGSTSAALGSGITENSSLTINSEANQTINNNVDVSALTGDATVASNTRAGNAISGDANAAANILNINSSNFVLSDWFGVLFINVFGKWHGSFGIDTDAGETPTPVIAPVITSALTSAPTALAATEVQAFRFVPASDGSYAVEKTDEGIAALASAQVLGNTTQKPTQTQHEKDTAAAKRSDWLFSVIGIGIAASLLGTERVLTNRAKKNA